MQKGQSLQTDGEYGPETEAAVRAFAEGEGLAFDGSLSPSLLEKTRKRLSSGRDDWLIAHAKLQLETSSVLGAAVHRLKVILKESGSYDGSSLKEWNTRINDLRSFGGRLVAGARLLASWKTLAALIVLAGAGFITGRLIHRNEGGWLEWLGPLAAFLASAAQVLRSASRRVDEAVGWLDGITRPAIELAEDARALQEQKRRGSSATRTARWEWLVSI